ncbi:hypothetical protein QYM36_000237 [Artemia franciscana]|uniref:Amine oxidase domain-containing protein n=1 Tax=Artemia franciscana TaxID=6661 RepID=A0AA88I7M6_ARTSF|nr:hypothetical protein QYM36_000237 [Artemia franciscana]
MSRVLVVGCGCTGALIAALLRRNKKLINITMWDKSKGAGGRMSTSRSPQDNSCTADLGCQYITQHSSYLNKHSSYYEELKNASILVPLNTEIEYAKNNENDTNYVTPAGVSSIVKYYIKESQCCSSYQMQLDSIVKKEGSWMVKAIDGSEGVFDSVVLTIPVPQLFLLQGDMPSILSASSQVKSNLEEVDYSSRYALGLFFDKGVKLDEPWSGKYVNDHPIFRFIAIDNKKRGQVE